MWWRRLIDTVSSLICQSSGSNCDYEILNDTVSVLLLLLSVWNSDLVLRSVAHEIVVLRVALFSCQETLCHSHSLLCGEDPVGLHKTVSSSFSLSDSSLLFFTSLITFQAPMSQSLFRLSENLSLSLVVLFCG